jgi:hypothetical protein
MSGSFTSVPARSSCAVRAAESINQNAMEAKL